MKIRLSHITNSSSSSYLLRTQSPTIEVADAIINGLYRSNEIEDFYDDEDYRNLYTRRFQAFSRFKRTNANFDLPILIPWTCNYETWIYRSSLEEISVNACNNHPIDEWILRFGILSRNNETYEGCLKPPLDLSFLNLDNFDWTTLRLFNESWHVDFPYLSQVPQVPQSPRTNKRQECQVKQTNFIVTGKK